MLTYVNAQEAFEDQYNRIHELGENRNKTLRLRNVGFNILNPEDRHIKTEFRKWNPKYAEREWKWYLSENQSVEEIAKFAPIWDKMHGGDKIVNSNYGYQWNRNNQLEKCIDQLRKNPTTRQAWLTIHDGKEKHLFDYDTPCTLHIGFEINNDNKLAMDVLMRSNDLWFGFCNDQYCFSKLQSLVAYELGCFLGNYFHYSSDLHLYERHLNKN